MAAISAKEKKTTYYLTLSLVVIVLLACLFFVWRVFFSRPISVPVEMTLKPAEIKINFEVLTSQILKDLQSFEDVKPIQEQVGRENPFNPY